MRVALGDVAQQRHDLVPRLACASASITGVRRDLDPDELRHARRLGRIVAAHAHLDGARLAVVVGVGEGRHVGGPVEHVDAIDQAAARRARSGGSRTAFRPTCEVNSTAPSLAKRITASCTFSTRCR